MLFRKESSCVLKLTQNKNYEMMHNISKFISTGHSIFWLPSKVRKNSLKIRKNTKKKGIHCLFICMASVKS